MNSFAPSWFRLAMAWLCVVAAFHGLAAFAAEPWPSAIEQYEAIAAQQPGRSEALWQIWKYAGETGRLGELKERWEVKTTGREGGRYRVLLALLAEMELDPATALAEVARATEQAPQSVEAWLWRGRIEALQKKPDARVSLEKALALEKTAGGDGHAAGALAEEHLAAGRRDEAHAVLDQAIPTVRQPEGWLQLTQQRAEVALAQGKLAELIAQVSAAPRRPEGGSELAQVYLGVRDYAAASAVLTAARRDHPEDALLRRQALAVARAADRKAEIARLLREEAKLAPTPQVWSDLFRVSIEMGSAAEARIILAQQGARLFSEPESWRLLYSRIWQLDLARPMAEALAKTGGEVPSWEAALVRAELLIAEGDREPAEKALWTLFDAQLDGAAALSSRERREAMRGTPDLSTAAISQAHLTGRLKSLGDLLNAPPWAFNPTLQVSDELRPAVDTITEARDLALLYLAVMAVEKQAEPAFVEELTKRIAGWPVAERILAWAIVRNPVGLLHEMTVYAASPRTLAADRFCVSQLAALRRLRMEPALTREMSALEGKMTLPMGGDEPARTLDMGERFRESNRRFATGKFSEAAAMYAEAAAAIRASGSVVAERERVGGAMSFALLLPEFQSDAGRKVEAAALAVGSIWSVAGYHRRLQVGDITEALFPTERPAEAYRFFERGTASPISLDALPSEQRPRMVYPPRSLFTWEETGVLWTVFGQMRDRQLWPQLKRTLDIQVARAPVGQAIYGRVAVAYLAWWNREEDDAIARMRRLALETADPDIQLGLAAMLRHAESPANAEKAVALIPPRYPGDATFEYGELCLAGEARDAAAVDRLAAEVAKLPLETKDLRMLVQELRKSGQAAAVALFRPRLDEAAGQEEDDDQLAPTLDDLAEGGARVEAIALARRVLDTVPVPRSMLVRSSARAKAVEVLQRFGEQEKYQAELERRTAAAPREVEGWRQLAEVSSESAAPAVWRQVLALRPDDLHAAIEILNAKGTSGEEGRRIFETMLAIEPEQLLQRRGSAAFEDYKTAKELPQLAAVIEKAAFRDGRTGRLRTQNWTIWRDWVKKFKDAQQPDGALRLLRKAVVVLYPTPPEARRMLLEQLVTLQRREEAGWELIECLAPETASLPQLFAWQPSNTAAIVSRSPLDLKLLQMAQSLGVAPELRERLAEAARRDATARIVWTFVRVADRNPAVLPDIQTLAAELGSGTADRSWVLPLARQLADWPEATAAQRQLLTSYDVVTAASNRGSPSTVRLETARLLAKAGDREASLKIARASLQMVIKSTGGSTWRTIREVGEVALLTKDDTLLDDCTVVLTRLAGDKTPGSGSFPFGEAIKFAGLLADAGKIEPARQLLATIRAGLVGRRDTTNQQWLRIAEAEIGMRAGDGRLGVPIVWLDSDRTTAEQATLVWDLGLPDGTRNRTAAPTLRGEPIPQLDGRYTVELLFGETEETMQSLSVLPASAARGTWQGRLPVSSGFVRAIFSREGETLFGGALGVIASPNLLQSAEAKETPNPAATEATRVDGGPVAGGSYQTFRGGTNENGGPSQRTVVGPRVKIQTGRDFQLSAWIRGSEGRSPRLAWQCYDRDGKLLEGGQTSYYSMNDRYWSYNTIRLNWPRQNAGGRRLPLGTAYIEPVVELAGNFDLTGLSLLELPEASTPEP